jgi:phosphatidylglycerol lysyltransferase
VLLLLLAYGVQQRLRWAWTLSAVLLCAGAVSVMLKSFAWEEAVTLAVLLFALLPARREFLLASSSPSQQYAFDWFVAIAVVLTTALWLGLFSYKHLDAAEWWRFTLYGNASRFLRASIGVAIVALGAAGYRLLSVVRYRRTAVLR